MLRSLTIYSFLKPLLFALPEEIAHHLSLQLLAFAPKALFSASIPETQPIDLFGLTFPNRVGLAAGLDKNGEFIEGLAKLGFGFIEIGTVTPKPQAGNPKPRLFRCVQDQAIINRMGFNNKGVDYLVKQVRASKYKGILGINIGKNLQTSIHDAVSDYVYCFDAVYDVASYITVNVSSPNTPGLRDLQHGELLVSLFSALKKRQRALVDKYGKYVPMLAKLAPDLDEQTLKQTVCQLTAMSLDGFVFSNTTNDKSTLLDKHFIDEQGGLSGQPLFGKSTQLLKIMRAETDLPIIGVGGIMSGANAQQKIQAGASLIQLYSGLIFQGPDLISDCIKASKD